MTLARIGTATTLSDYDAVSTKPVQNLTIVSAGNATFAYGLTADPTDGLVVFQVAANGALSYRDNVLEVGESATGYYAPYQLNDPSDLVALRVGTKTMLFSDSLTLGNTGGLVDRGLTSYVVRSDGSLAEDGIYRNVSGNLQSIAGVQTGNQSLVFQIRDGGTFNDDSLVVYRFGTTTSVTGGLTYDLDSSKADQTYALGGVGDNVYFFYLADISNEVVWSAFQSSGQGLFYGRLANTGVSSPTRAITDMDVLGNGSDGYLVTINPLAGLKLYDIGPGAAVGGIPELATVDAANGTAGWAASEVEAFSIGTRNFVATGGDTLGIFEIGADGSLTLVDQVAATQADDLDVLVRGGNATVIVTSDAGISSYAFTPGQAQNFNGTAAADRLIGDARDNTIEGLSGNDVIKGKAGVDDLFGNNGSDSLYGGSGDDHLFGGYGRDFLGGGAGADYLDGNGGADRLKGGGGNDKLIGNSGKDVLLGGGGNDSLLGGSGKDTLKGGGGKDSLSGSNGNDRLLGGGGKDKLDDGAGKDVLKGGGGRDTFIFTQDNTRDKIVDWSHREKIDFSDYAQNLKFSDLEISDAAGGKVKIVAAGDVLIVDAKADLHASDFHAHDFIF